MIYAINVAPDVQACKGSDFDQVVSTSPTTVDGWNVTVVGAGTVTAGSAFGNSCGIVRLGTGTTTTGAGILSTSSNDLKLGNGIVAFKSNIQLPTLSDGSNTYAVRIGLNSATDGTQGIDGVMFEYSSATAVAGGMGGNWRCLTVSGTTATTINTGVAAYAVGTASNPLATGLRFVVAPDRSRVDFYINGTAVGFSTTNIPTVSMSWCMSILKSAGTTARNLDVDYEYRRFEFTTPRL